MNQRFDFKKIDFDELKGKPKVYRFNQALRFSTLFFGFFAIAFSVYMIFTKIGQDSSTIQKILPFIIMYFALASFLKNILSVNSVWISKTNVTFKFLARKKVVIPFKDLKRLEFSQKRQKAIRFIYNVDGERKEFLFPLMFKEVLEIINAIASHCPDLDWDDFLDNVIIKPDEFQKDVEEKKQDNKEK